MKHIEQIIQEWSLPDKNSDGEEGIFIRKHYVKECAKAIEQYVIKVREEVLFSLVPNHLIIEKCLWFGRDNDSTREMRVEINHIDNDLSKPLNYEEAFKKAIAELKKGLQPKERK